MDICDARHEPKFQVKYLSAKGTNFNPIWLVCEMCMGKDCFGNKDQIISMEVLV
jgi:hypothetical protein